MFREGKSPEAGVHRLNAEAEQELMHAWDYTMQRRVDGMIQKVWPRATPEERVKLKKRLEEERMDILATTKNPETIAQMIKARVIDLAQELSISVHETTLPQQPSAK